MVEVDILHRQRSGIGNRAAGVVGRIFGKGGIGNIQRPGTGDGAAVAAGRIPGKGDIGNIQRPGVDDGAAVAAVITVPKGYVVEANIIAGGDIQKLDGMAAVECDPSFPVNDQRSILRKRRQIDG